MKVYQNIPAGVVSRLTDIVFDLEGDEGFVDNIEGENRDHVLMKLGEQFIAAVEHREWAKLTYVYNVFFGTQEEILDLWNRAKARVEGKEEEEDADV